MNTIVHSLVCNVLQLQHKFHELHAKNVAERMAMRLQASHKSDYEASNVKQDTFLLFPSGFLVMIKHVL